MSLSSVEVSTEANRVFSIILLILAGLTTVARIYIRYQNRRLWWDDCWAVLTFSMLALMVAAYFFTDIKLLPTSAKTRKLQIAQSWIFVLGYSFGSWCGRMSLLLSIIRLIPPIFTLRRVSEHAFIFFCVMCISLAISKVYICASDLGWYSWPHPLCNMGNKAAIAIAELATAVVGDLTLVFIPIRLLSFIGLPTKKRRMLILLFSANMITSIISIFHAVFLSASAWSLLTIVNTAEPGSALIMANATVLAPYIYRIIRREGDFDSKPYTYYRSVQEDGSIRMRRVSDLTRSNIRFNSAVPPVSLLGTSENAEESLANLSGTSSGENGKDAGIKFQASFATLSTLDPSPASLENTKNTRAKI
ncbi:hypothetical protein D9757_010599 [Collybiopsis confluens]|uniref:Rhodopsin domain-containing protein n=1 Tax=Collybiopsis confluens TaxID=2823264 RepID=A0A8H5GVM1_9AGAR|nr:hypothetical protein D9757_010599 [Collybiopsis confluens]